MLVVISFVTVCSLAFSRTFAKPQNRSSPSPSLFQDPVTVSFCLGEESARWKKGVGKEFIYLWQLKTCLSSKLRDQTSSAFNWKLEGASTRLTFVQLPKLRVMKSPNEWLSRGWWDEYNDAISYKLLSGLIWLGWVLKWDHHLVTSVGWEIRDLLFLSTGNTCYRIPVKSA